MITNFFLFNPMTPKAFCLKTHFWTFWTFSGLIWAKLAPIYSKRHLQTWQQAFLSTSVTFWNMFAWACAEIKILSLSINMWWQEILLWVFHSNLWGFLCIFQAPLSWSLRSRYHWRNLFLLQKLSKADANFGQRLWRTCKKWNKGQGLSQAVTGSHGSQWVKSLSDSLGKQYDIFHQRSWLNYAFLSKILFAAKYI